MTNSSPPHSPEAIIEEGQKLLKKRPRCHKTLNDLTAATLIAKMRVQGLDVALDDAEQCIRRMRIAVDTGTYPDELLRKAGEAYFPRPTGLAVA